MFGGFDTVFPPCTEGHNWETISIQSNPSLLCRSSTQAPQWRLNGNNLSLQRLVTKKEFWETILEYRRYYQRYREITSNLLRCESEIDR